MNTEEGESSDFEEEVPEEDDMVDQDGEEEDLELGNIPLGSVIHQAQPVSLNHLGLMHHPVLSHATQHLPQLTSTLNFSFPEERKEHGEEVQRSF
jgi:hypothetical protein